MTARLLTIALRNMRRQLRRTILTGLTFAIAVFIYTVLVAVPWSMDRIADNASKGLRLVVTERNNGRLPARYCEPIKKLRARDGMRAGNPLGRDLSRSQGPDHHLRNKWRHRERHREQRLPDTAGQGEVDADGSPQRDGRIRAHARARMETRSAAYAAQSRAMRSSR